MVFTELSLHAAMEVLKEAIRDDDAYARRWHADIAMVIKAAGVDHKTANKIAANLLQIYFGRNTYDLI